MKAFVIILAVIICIVSVFYIPVYFDIELGKKNNVVFGYLFFKKLIFPNDKPKKDKEPKKQKKKSKKSPQKNKPKPKKETTSSDFNEILNTLKEQLPNIKKTTKALLSAIKIRKLNVNWRIGSDDAFDTAMKYGKYNGGFFIVYGMLSNIISIKPEKINIYPDFLSEDEDIDVKMRIYISPAKVISAAVGFAVGFIKSYLNTNKNNKEKAVN